MSSMAAIPPLAVFSAKFYIFMAAIDARLFVIAVIGVVSSVVGAYYYIRIVKLMYFAEPVGAPFDRPIGVELQAVLVLSAVVILFFFIFPGPISGAADAATAALFPG